MELNNNNGNNVTDRDRTISEYDRLRGSLEDTALSTKPSTVQTITPMTGRATTFIIRTFRTEKGDTIFVEAMTQEGLIRVALPPDVANAVARQRDALTTRRRSIAGKARVANMTDEQRQASRDRLAKARLTRKPKAKA